MCVFLNIYLFVYLAALGLSHGRPFSSCGLWVVELEGFIAVQPVGS